MSDIALSSGVRANLTSLKGIASMLSTSQERLATGKKVNSALDNPRNFFTAKGMSERGASLKGLLDGISTASQTVKAADNALKSMTKFLQAAKSLAETAKTSVTDAANYTGTNAITNGTGATPKERALTASLATNGVGNGDTLTFEVTKNGVTSSFDVAGGVGKTVQDLVDEVNASGVITAKVNENGTLEFNAVGVDNIANFTITSSDNTATDLLGFDATTGVVDGGAIVSVGTGEDSSSQIVELINQYNNTQKDAVFNGINLLEGGASNDLKVIFDADSKSSLTISSRNLASSEFANLDLASIDASNAQDFIDAVDSALASIKGTQTSLGTSLTILQERDSFTQGLINTLQVGADNLTLADQNEEAANVLALQTRQSLAQSALSLANQADQAVLQLLR